ncbi:hypothetical protein [Neptuniibacter caesariensis]|uniref:Membrane protein, putative n=1 Tax=Neptuniibacter caesariensis TaxID=207954 RepID=A0A7U8C6L6_NEPCE|nr:hypothetical protein [Neptuniibacter caesariensis]EAR60859.1 membrane protein, putative [Oceanospirillum sp. MED92] [Neptuniibacter caesariensis]
MRALAELVMKGRKQAALVAIIAALLPMLYWASAAAVALITLRKGTSDGAGVLVWALLPAGAWAFSGDPTPLAVITGTFLLAITLRETVSWAKVLMLALPIGALAGIGLETVLDGLLGQVIEATEKFLSQSAHQSGEVNLDTERLRLLLVGGLGSVHTAFMVLSLILARSWQSGLYNPGGFKQEFHVLKLPQMYTAILLASLLTIYQLELDFMRWLPLLLLPWIFAGIALIHGSLAKRDLGRSWLIAFYLAIVFIGPYVITLLVFAAILDSFVDFRARIPAKN